VIIEFAGVDITWPILGAILTGIAIGLFSAWVAIPWVVDTWSMLTRRFAPRRPRRRGR
jgi:hypothetical protein